MKFQDVEVLNSIIAVSPDSDLAGATNHVETAAPAVWGSEALRLDYKRRPVELRSTGQPRAAVPTWLVVVLMSYAKGLSRCRFYRGGDDIGTSFRCG